jgi:hypothetical protein
LSTVTLPGRGTTSRATVHFIANDRQSQRSEVAPFEETYVEEWPAEVGTSFWQKLPDARKLVAIKQ